jgi:uncharacterized membrane protein YoaK (UPF0700 family)
MASSAQALREDAAQSLLHPLTRALLALTFTTGLVDAVSYLGLGHVFTANMTGNVVLLGFGIAGAGGLPVVAPLISLGAFLVGGFAGGALADRVAERHDLWIGATLAIEVAFVTASGIVAVAARLHPATFAGDLVIALLAVAMGVRNATVRKLGVPDLTTTVLTMTLTGLSSELAASGGGGSRTATVRRVAAVVTMLAGAVVGALLVKTSLAIALFSAAAVAAAAALVYVPVAIGWRQR